MLSAPFARQQVIFGGVGRLTASEHRFAKRIGVRNECHDATEHLVEIRMIDDASAHTNRTRLIERRRV